MAEQGLDGLKIAILATDGFEEVELTEPRKALDAAGADTVVGSPKDHDVRSWRFTEWGDTVPVDRPLDQARAKDFDALFRRTQYDLVAHAKDRSAAMPGPIGPIARPCAMVTW